MRRLVSPYVLDLGLCFVALIWGASATIFKIALAEVQPLTFVIMRFFLLSLMSVVILLSYARRHPAIRPFRIHRSDVALLIVSGLAGYGIYQLFYVEGLYRTTAFATSLLGATVPLWSAVILAALRVERIQAWQWVGIIISLCGIAWFLMAQPSVAQAPIDRALTPGSIVLGNILLCVAAGLFALYGIVNKRLTTRYSSPELMCYTLIIGTVTLTPFGIAALVQQDWSHVTWAYWAILLFSVLFPIYFAYSIWNWAIARRGVGYVTLYSYAVPVLGGIIGYLVLNESLGVWQLVAAAVVIGGMLLARWAITRQAPPATPPVSDADILPAPARRVAHEVTD